MRVTAEALEEFGHKIDKWELLPSRGGKFELTIDGELRFSKKQLNRHAEDGEIQQILTEHFNAD